MAFQLVDDYSGEALDRDHPSLDLRVGLEAWRLYLSDTSKKELMKALEPFVNDAEPMVSRTAPKAGKGRGRTPVETYDFDFNEVRTWAIANKMKAKSGKPITETTRVLNQDIYNAYRDAQK